MALGTVSNRISRIKNIYSASNGMHLCLSDSYGSLSLAGRVLWAGAHHTWPFVYGVRAMTAPGKPGTWWSNIFTIGSATSAHPYSTAFSPVIGGADIDAVRSLTDIYLDCVTGIGYISPPGSLATQEYYGVPFGKVEEFLHASRVPGAGTPGKLFNHRLLLDTQNSGVNGRFCSVGEEMKFRPIWRKTLTDSDQLPTVEIEDITTSSTPVTMNLKTEARKRWSDGDDPTLEVARNAKPGLANAYFTDIDWTGTASGTVSIEFRSNTGSNTIFTYMGGVAYSNERTDGAYLAHLGDQSWALKGLGIDDASSSSIPKRMTTAEFIDILDQLILDIDEQLYVWVYVAMESWTAEEIEDDANAVCDRIDAAAEAIGLTKTPIIILVGPHNAKINSVWDETQAEVFQNAYLTVSRERENVVFLSLYEYTNGTRFDGSAPAQSEMAALGFGPGNNFEYGTNSVDLSGGLLLDAQMLHPLGKDSAAFFAYLISEIINTTNVVQLPAPESWRDDQLGGPHFFIVCAEDSAGETVVEYTRGGTELVHLVTLQPGQVAKIFLIDNSVETGEYEYYIRTLGVARPVGGGTQADIENPETITTYSNLNCFEGDPCELARFLGNEPLDGEDGRSECIVPMFQDVIEYAKNASREPIRAADVVMPSVIPVWFELNSFTPDAAHPHAGTVLPQTFYDALYNNEKPHGLIYDGTAHGTSRHWHHIRWEGASWELGSLAVKRHVWKKEIVYVASDGSNKTLELRFVVEHTVDPEPELDPSGGGGGQNNRTDGSWGALFNLYVFTNEIAPTFMDGQSYTPAGSSGAVTFTKNDPCAWGEAPGVGENPEDKFCHPQMVFCACTPTTFQAPMGSDWVPWEDRKWLKAFKGGYTLRGKHREHCYLWSNGAPWTPGTCPDDAPAGVGRMGNVVFGWTFGTTSGACMSNGGAFPRSKPTEWLTFENGLGVGRTYLIPTKPGWDEECGNLDVPGGSSGSIRFCIEDEWGIDDGTGKRYWPVFEPIECNGHPDEPFEDVGGGHSCFNNNGVDTDTKCCIKTTQQSVQAVEYCTTVITTYGNWNGSTCDLGGVSCQVGSRYFRDVVVEFEDFTYLMNGGQENRVISWVRLLPDPDQIFYDYVYDDSDLGDFSNIVGTWTLGATTIQVASTNNAVLLKAALFYKPTSAIYRDVLVTAKAELAKQASHGIILRGEEVGADFLDGYVFIITPTGGDNATVALKLYQNNVVTKTIRTKNISNLTSEIVTLSFEVWGGELLCSWTVDGEDVDTFDEAEHFDCTLLGIAKAVGLVTETNSTSVRFSEFVVDDKSTEFISIEASMSQEVELLSFPEELMEGYGKCEEIYGGDCNTSPPPICNCSIATESMKRETSANHTGVILLPDCENEVNGDNPTIVGGPMNRCDCEGEWCNQTTWYCGNCPFPFPALSLNIWDRCPVFGETEVNMCAGMTKWFYLNLTCD